MNGQLRKRAGDKNSWTYREIIYLLFTRKTACGFLMVYLLDVLFFQHFM